MVDLGIGRSKVEVRDRTQADSDDTEITLGTGKLLSIFFGLVFVCAIFFTLGYLLGHSTAAGDKTEIVGASPTAGSPAGKPSAVNKNPEPQPATAGPAPGSAGNDATGTQAAPSAVPVSSPAPATDIKAAPGGTYTVQVAAVSKKEDADNLVTALI